MAKLSVKDRVLKQARLKFLKHGFYKTSMDSLVQELRTSKSSLYNHYASKEDLVQAVIDSINSEINQKLEKVLADEELNFKEKLIAIATFTRELLIQVSEEFLRDLETITPEVWTNYQVARQDRIDRYYRRLFEIGTQEGLIRDDVDTNLILTVYLTLTEIPVKATYINHLKMSNQEIYENITEIFLNGVLKT
jgi:AcrR family transcriptional regulator